jgi:hypothetical protein
LVSKRVFRGSLLAQRRTMQMGGGIEFADHREYTPGDDFRYLDWNLYARHDELLLKRFQEEEDLHVYFLLRALERLAHGGRLAFIMPADTCEGVFAPQLWSWIARHYRLDAVVTRREMLRRVATAVP